VIELVATIAYGRPLFANPAPGLAHPKSWSRNLDCERLSTEAAVQQFPGQIFPEAPRGEYVERDAVVCRQRLAPPGLRSPRDEAVLMTLDATAADLASAAQSLRPDLADRTWLVEAYYPSGPVAAKVSFAAKAALMDRGLTVSDRTPTLAAADLDVLARLDADQAFPGGCQRYAATGSLRDDDVLLAVLLRDPRETVLHAGLCARGAWTWVK
jgi:hypothetical protein